MKPVLLPICGGILAMALSAGAAGVRDPFPDRAASYVLRADGATIWEHRPDLRLPPASLTKIMTALLVLERGRLDETVVVGGPAARETGTRIGLAKGDRMRAADLLAATLLGSANDACRALADHAAGSEAEFVRRMNARARELGMDGTRFANSTGHHDPGHYSTARDLLLLTETALRNEAFAELVATVRKEIRTADGRRRFLLENKNEMVGRYPGAVGVKTGYTKEAGPCLAVLAERGKSRVLLILLNAPNRWWDAVAMLDSAFALPRESARETGTR